jgi:hypothetical protein
MEMYICEVKVVFACVTLSTVNIGLRDELHISNSYGVNIQVSQPSDSSKWQL